MTFEFKAKSIKRNIEAGYYFNDEFLSRYKIEALGILRNRIENLSLEEREKTEEWMVIHEEYEKAKEKSRLTEEKKKKYYEATQDIRNIALQEIKIKNDILRKRKRIAYFENRKKIIISHYDDRIKRLEQNIIEMEEKL